jgi:hypothetical protein
LRHRYFSHSRDAMPNDALARGGKFERFILLLVAKLPRIRDQVASNFRKKAGGADVVA